MVPGVWKASVGSLSPTGGIQVFLQCALDKRICLSSCIQVQYGSYLAQDISLCASTLGICRILTCRLVERVITVFCNGDSDLVLVTYSSLLSLIRKRIWHCEGSCVLLAKCYYQLYDSRRPTTISRSDCVKVCEWRISLSRLSPCLSNNCEIQSIVGHSNYVDQTGVETCDQSKLWFQLYVLALQALCRTKQWGIISLQSLTRLQLFTYIQHVGITLTFIYCIFSFCLYFLSFDPPLASLSFAPSFWRHLSLSLLFPPTQPAHSFIPTLSVSHPYYQLHFNLHPPSLLSDPYVYVCAFHQIYYRTNSTLPPTSGLPVCTAASHTANTTTILQRCYYKLT